MGVNATLIVHVIEYELTTKDQQTSCHVAIVPCDHPYSAREYFITHFAEKYSCKTDLAEIDGIRIRAVYSKVITHAAVWWL